MDASGLISTPSWTFSKRVWALGGAWLVAALVVVGGLVIHAHRPGQGADPGPGFPEQSGLPRLEQSPLLLVFIHPECPCSRATLSELETLLPALAGKVGVEIVVSERAQFPDGARRTAELKDRFERVGVRVIEDQNDVEAGLFGVKTSGQTLLYDREKHLVFRGGITPARGHEGDSEGRAAILRFARTSGQVADGTATPVFGCSYEPRGGGDERTGYVREF